VLAVADTDLRAPGRILLVSCYELGHLPHGLAMPQAFLRRAGFAPATVDLSVERLAAEAVDRARLVAISVPMHTALRLGIGALAAIRARNPAVGVCFYGTYAPLNADHLRRLGADWVLGGEHEAALVALAKRLADGDGTAPAPPPITLTKLSFPAPAREELRLDRYARFDPGDGSRRLAGYTEASRGCLDTCRHCPVPAVYGGRFFVVDRRLVLSDIAAQVEAGARHITFGDPDFFNGPGHTLAVVRELHRRWPDLTFDVTTQVSHILRHRRHLAELRASGCAFVVSAVESLSDLVLARLRKRHRRADVLEALALCRAADLPLRPTFVTFTPWTTLDDVCALVDFVVEHDLCEHVDPVQLSVRLLVPPGSLLLSEPDTRGFFGALDPAALGHVWRHPDARVDELWREIARLVADAAEAEEPAWQTFAAIRAAVHRAAGQAPPTTPPRSPRRVPRVTEPWFC
jgi:radical SAM superfamily enzyme YgiQ (UPF0313 family)